jgi:hypothetical protein
MAESARIAANRTEGRARDDLHVVDHRVPGHERFRPHDTAACRGCLTEHDSIGVTGERIHLGEDHD